MKRNILLATSLLITSLMLPLTGSAFTLHVQDPDGNPVFGFRWLVEEDTSHPVDPDVPSNDELGLSIHKSYAPVVAKGSESSFVANINVPADKRYVVSVLPNYVTPPGGGSPRYTMSGGNVAIGQTDLTVVVHPTPIPTAQISILAFEDNFPINNAPDLPAEHGLGGFDVKLFDYAGRVSQDAFGNPLGTTYQRDGAGNALLNPDGTPIVDVLGSGVLLTGDCPAPPLPANPSCGVIRVKNLVPGKYGVILTRPPGTDWVQTSTIEGTPTVDAWVKANEPPFFVEFGPAGHHVFTGFVHPTSMPAPAPGDEGTVTTISGKIVAIHNSRPPEFTFYKGRPVPECWVGLNSVAIGIGQGLAAQPCNEDSTFSIANVPPGNYQLAIWDKNLDFIFSSQLVTVDADGITGNPVGCNGNPTCALGDIAIFDWWKQLTSCAFIDDNENGFPDEVTDPKSCNGIFDQVINLRFKDGTVYQTMPTDGSGMSPMQEVFPFFKWLVVEADFARYRATGATIVVDAGGPIPAHNGWTTPSFDVLNPQAQCVPNLDPTDNNPADLNGRYGDCIPHFNPYTGNTLARTITGDVLTLGFQNFLGQADYIFWGKKAYGPADVDNAPYGNFPGPEDTDNDGDYLFDPGNGGITGIVYYDTTRAEDDPTLNFGEPWQPGIPRVQVVLYQDSDTDNVIDDLDGDGVVTLADVDNYPFGWRDGGPMGPEDIKRNGPNAGLFDPHYIFNGGDAIQVATTDSWEDNLPTGCPPNPSQINQGTQAPFYINGNPATPAMDCFEGMRTFNQVREAVFDGGYAFNSHYPEGMESGNPEIPGIPDGTYIVETVPTLGYEIVKEEDKNVDFGDTFVPSPLALPPACVGDPHTVPQYLTFFPLVESAYAGQTRPLCNRKAVTVVPGKNAPADFFLFTEVPKAGRIVGFILNDLANEFDPNKPAFGEKFAPPYIPVSVRDWTGHELLRVHSDGYGNYNAMVPSTYTANVPSPSGVSPNMLTVCLNDPGPIPNPAYVAGGTEPQFITDPHFQTQYTQFCYTFDYMPGKTTYLDTPVLPTAAFAGAAQFPLDCEFPDGTPVISTVFGNTYSGPYASQPGVLVHITSLGDTQVLNPAYQAGGTEPQKITRDFGFGAAQGTGIVEIVAEDGTVLTPTINSWSNGVIEIVAPNLEAHGGKTGQLRVVRDNGLATVMGVTLTVDNTTSPMNVVQVPPGGSVQAAIDSATSGSLVLVPPGLYHELVIVPQNIKLQGAGAPSTAINGQKNPAENIVAWRNKITTLVTADPSYILPAQVPPGGIPALIDPEPGLFVTEQGPAITVLASTTLGDFTAASPARIDGLTVTGADAGGLFVNANADYLEIGNNLFINNQGFYSGAIRIGNPFLQDALPTARGGVADSDNDHVRIHHNHIVFNGALNGAGAGISLFTGTDDYVVSANNICGNFSSADGGGIGHLGQSNRGRIESNTILFNQSFNQGKDVSGGGIVISGIQPAPPLGAPPGAPLPLGAGAGTVTIDGNLIQGNLAGAGDGGGIRAQFVNGTDVENFPTDDTSWHRLNIVNNMIVNNVAGLAGAGISLQDAVRVTIDHNTVANNDSTASAGKAFTPGNLNDSNPQPAGIVSRLHTNPALEALPPVANPSYSDPELVNNIIWHNRSFYWHQDAALTPPWIFLPDPATPNYWDLAVLGGSALDKLHPMYSILTDTTGYDTSNASGDPLFVAEYSNGDSSLIVIPENTTPIGAPAFDEGGNFIDVRFGPLTTHNPATGLPFGDYHIQDTSPAKDFGDAAIVVGDLLADFDGQARPSGVGPDSGADEILVIGGGSIGPDSDGDGVPDATDNCIDVANADQTDSNGDGYGNICDTDLNGDLITNLIDVGILKSQFLSSGPDADFNSDGIVNLIDVGILKQHFLSAPGPSGVAP